MPLVAQFFIGAFQNHPVLCVVAVLALAILLRSIRIAQEYERAVIFLFGRLIGTRGPGLYLVIPIAERATVVDTRTITHQLDTQETITSDGVAVRLNAVVWYRAADPARTIIEVRDWNDAVRQAAETTLRDTIGQNELDKLLTDRISANATLKRLLTATVEKWGVEVSAVELKDLDIPENMQRAIAREAEAIREKRARIIKAEGEFQASSQLTEAANKMAGSPGAMELRRLQTMSEIGVENNSVIIVAMPLDGAAAAATGAFNAAFNEVRKPG
jgi:regulator of protease activity HflC (stomatin/prohibitin superfamily)